MESPSFLSPNPNGSGNVSSSDYSSDYMTDMYDLTPPFNTGNNSSSLTTPTNQRKSSKKTASTFIQKLYNMLENNTHGNLISWCPSGTSFSISNAKAFASEVLPAHFKHSNFSSFVRLLNMYGFHKINKSPRGQRSSENEIWEFSHTKFIRGRSDLLKDIKRKSMDSETLRRETGDIQASFAMLQMSQSDLLQQFYTLQESFTSLFNGLQESRKIQQQQQQQIRQLFERQGLDGNKNTVKEEMKWEPTDMFTSNIPSTEQDRQYKNEPPPQQQQQQKQQQQSTRTQHHRRTISTPSLSSNQIFQQLQNQYQQTSQQPQALTTDEPFRMLVTTPPSVQSNYTQGMGDSMTPAYWMNHMRSLSQPPESQGNAYSNDVDRKPQQQADAMYSPLTFQTAVNTPLPPSPMMLVSPDVSISPGSSEDSLSSYPYNLDPSNTLDSTFM